MSPMEPRINYYEILSIEVSAFVIYTKVLDFS